MKETAERPVIRRGNGSRERNDETSALNDVSPSRLSAFITRRQAYHDPVGPSAYNDNIIIETSKTLKKRTRSADPV